MGDPHREDDAGHNWAVLSDARSVREVVSGSAVVLGSSIGRYLAKVVSWDFEVSDEDPIVTLELLPVRRARSSASWEGTATLPRDSGAPGRLYWLRRARYSSRASSGMWAMPCTMT